MYTCINRLPPDARREYLDWNPLLIQVDLDDEVRQEFLNALDTCLDSVVKFSPKVPQTWYPEATTTIMKRVERLHDVLQEEAEPRGNDEYFLVRSHEAKLYLDWTWGTSDEGAEDFEVVFFGDDFAQEACIKMRPTT